MGKSVWGTGGAGEPRVGMGERPTWNEESGTLRERRGGGKNGHALVLCFGSTGAACGAGGSTAGSRGQRHRAPDLNAVERFGRRATAQQAVTVER